MNDLAESNGRKKLGSKIARESFSDEPSFGKKKKKKIEEREREASRCVR